MFQSLYFKYQKTRSLQFLYSLNGVSLLVIKFEFISNKTERKVTNVKIDYSLIKRDETKQDVSEYCAFIQRLQIKNWDGHNENAVPARFH